MKKFLLTCIAVACSLVAVAEELLIEAESFSQRGGWVLDQQFMDQMGSPYLMGGSNFCNHPLGKPLLLYTGVTLKKLSQESPIETLP